MYMYVCHRAFQDYVNSSMSRDVSISGHGAMDSTGPGSEANCDDTRTGSQINLVVEDAEERNLEVAIHVHVSVSRLYAGRDGFLP
jgi:hypothetical protein